MKNNILQFINKIYFDKNLGKSWYKNANLDLQLILIDLNLLNTISINDVSLICSILSPANSWQKNVIDTKNLLKYYFYGSKLGETMPKFSTYGNNVLKALKYLKERNEFRFLNSHVDLYQTNDRFTSVWVKNNMKALKTYNFYIHLRNPDYLNTDGLYFTIDRHMLKIAGIDSKAITPKQYKVLQRIYFEVFKELEFECLFHEFQAVLWCNYVFINKGILHY
jgi:hypothetical protein